MSETQWTPEVLDELLSTGIAVDRGVRARHMAATDWGGVFVGPPPAVARPRDAAEVARIVGFAHERGLTLTPRATGASQSGQAVAAGSVVLDTSGLSRVESLNEERRTLTCGPGATWRGAFAAGLPRGLAPVVSVLQLDLTVGGVLSVGGFGSNSYRHGCSASNVEELEVVTGTGELVRCSTEREVALFEAVLGGLGRCGVVTRATIHLREVSEGVRIAQLSHADIGAWWEDLLRALEESAFTHIEAFCRRGGEPPFELHVANDAPGGTLAEMEEAIGRLRPGGVGELKEIPAMAYPARLDARFEEMIGSGRAGAAHPWVEALAPLEVVLETVPDVLRKAAGEPRDRIQIVLADADRLPRFVARPGRGVVACFVVVPVGIVPDKLPEALRAMREVHDLLLERGAKRYLTGWLPDVSDEAWRRHFGEDYEAWRAAKERYDPRGVFTSALFAAAGEG